MRRTLARIGAFVAALLLCLGVATPAAASEVEPGRSCSLTINVADKTVGAGELGSLDCTASLYRVASIDEDGALTPVDACADLADDLSQAQESGLASDWEAVAAEAAEAARDGRVEAAAVLALNGGTARKTGLGMGLYLVLIPDVAGAAGTYSFEAALVSLPQNLYLSTPGAGEKDDEWVYDVEVEPKVSYAENTEPVMPDVPTPTPGRTPSTGEAAVPYLALAAGGALCIACALGLRKLRRAP